MRKRDGNSDNIARLGRLQEVERLGRLQFDISFSQYDEVDIPGDSVVYCDPPYAGKAEYAADGFDHERFYDWLRTRDFPVWVSEYTMPGDFKRVWAQHKHVTLRDNGKRAIEGLWLHEKWFGKVYVADLFGYDDFQ